MIYFNFIRPILSGIQAKVVLKGETIMLDEKLLQEVWNDIENQNKPIL